MIKKKAKKEVKSAKVGEKVMSLGEWEALNPDKVKKPILIDKLTTTFPNEDLNKLVEKINEVIEKYNGSL